MSVREKEKAGRKMQGEKVRMCLGQSERADQGQLGVVGMPFVINGAI